MQECVMGEYIVQESAAWECVMGESSMELVKAPRTWQERWATGSYQPVKAFREYVSCALDAERGQWGLWPPVMIAMGIGWYFKAPVEPMLTVATMGWMGVWLGVAVALISRHSHLMARAMGWVMLWVMVGWGAAWWRTSCLKTPMLNHPLSVVRISGTVFTVAHPASSRRLFQRVVVQLHHAIKTPKNSDSSHGNLFPVTLLRPQPHAQDASRSKPPPQNATQLQRHAQSSLCIPKRPTGSSISTHPLSKGASTSQDKAALSSQEATALAKGACVQITIRTPCQPLLEGDVISLKANVIPIGESISGYQARRAFFFQGISATGFAVSAPTIHSRHPSRWSMWRHAITRQLMATMPAPLGSIACGLVTGDTLAIPPDVRQAFSITGLSHLLAISGLHLSLVSGVCFVACRWIIGRIAYAPLWINIDKVSGAITIALSWVYMMISGQRYPVQRAFWMLAATFCATLVARRRQSIRTLAQCAMVLLVCHPEALCNMGFQLSFTAVAALLSWSAYGRGRHDSRRRLKARLRRRHIQPWTWGMITSSVARWSKPLGKSIISSGVVTLATWPLMMHHFGQVSWQGLLTNVVAIPVMSLTIAPLGMLAVSTLSLSWGHWVLALWSWVLAWCVHSVQWLASWGNTLMWGGTSLSSMGCAMMMMGMFWTIIWQKSWRWWGLVVACGALILDVMMTPPVPTIILDANHRCAALCDPTQPVVWVTSLQRGKQYHRQWCTQWGKRTIQAWPQTAKECLDLGLPVWSIDESDHPHRWRLRIHALPPGSSWQPGLLSEYTLTPGMGVMALDACGRLWEPHAQRPWSHPRPLFHTPKSDMLRTPSSQPAVQSP